MKCFANHLAEMTSMFISKILINVNLIYCCCIEYIVANDDTLIKVFLLILVSI